MIEGSLLGQLSETKLHPMHNLAQIYRTVNFQGENLYTFENFCAKNPQFLLSLSLSKEMKQINLMLSAISINLYLKSLLQVQSFVEIEVPFTDPFSYVKQIKAITIVATKLQQSMNLEIDIKNVVVVLSA